MTIKAYCKEAGFSPWTFYNWRNRYGSRITSDTSTEKASLSSAEVSFTTLGALSLNEGVRPLLDIQLSSGITIRVYPGTTAVELMPFLSLLVESKLLC
jgi:hypothetical protein